MQKAVSRFVFLKFFLTRIESLRTEDVVYCTEVQHISPSLSF